MEEGRVVRLPEEYEHPKRWWQNWRWIAAVAFLLFSLGNVAWAATSVKTQLTLESRAKVVDEIRAVVQKLDNNQRGIDSLVAYVETIKAQQTAAGSQPNPVPILFEALCSSSDPITVGACKRLQDEGKIPKTFKPGG